MPKSRTTHSDPQPGRRKGTGPALPVLAVCGLLALAVVLIYGQTIGHDFVNFDDFDYVYDNPDITRGLTAETIRRAFTQVHSDNWHPLTTLSHLLDCQLFGTAPWGHHLGNVLLHAANAILLFLVLRRMTGDLWPSAFTAALFAVHPLRVESVAWVSERKDVLSGLFFMLTLAAYVQYVQRSPAAPGCVTAEGGRAPRTGRYLVVVLLFALGLMAKPMLVTLPFVLLLLDYWPLGRLRNPYSFRRLLLEKLPLLALSAVSCAATRLAQSETLQSIGEISLGVRVENALVSYAAYLGGFFYPVGLAVFYPHPGDGLPAWKVVGAALLLIGLSAACWAWRKKRPCLPVGWFWYLGMLVPVIGLVQVGQQAMADRYTYLPQIGLAVAIAWGLQGAPAARPRRAWILGTAAALVLIVLLFCARRQTSFWRDSETLWNRALACTSRNALANVNLGIVLTKAGRAAEALERFREALAIHPDDPVARNHLGVALKELGRADEAVEQYEAALRVAPHYVAALNNLGAALVDQGRLDDAVARLQKALEADPRNALAHYNLGNARTRQGRYDDAMAEYRRALELNENLADAQLTLGILLAGRGRFDEAVACFQKALAVRPELLNARRALAVAYRQLGKIPEAIAQWDEVLRFQPDDAEAVKARNELRGLSVP